MCYKCNNTKILNYNSAYNRIQNSRNNGWGIAIGIINELNNVFSSVFNNYQSGLYTNYSNETAYVGGGRAPKTPVKVAEEETPVVETDEEIKTRVLDLLKTRCKPNLDDETVNELVTRYKELKEFDSKMHDDILALRLENYVRGKNRHQQITNWDMQTEAIIKDAFAGDINANGITQALALTAKETDIISIKEDNEDKMSINKLKKLGLNFLEFYDGNCDEKVDIVELFKNDLISAYQVYEKCNYVDARAKAEAKIAELNIKTYDDFAKFVDEINLTTEDNILVNTLASTFIRFTKLNANGGDTLDLTELCSYLAGVAQYNSQDRKLDIADLFAFNNAMANITEGFDTYLRDSYNLISQYIKS